MAEFIQEYSIRIKGDDDMIYVVRAYAEERPDSTWMGWLEFHPVDDGEQPVLRTDQETSQPNRVTLDPSDPTYQTRAPGARQSYQRSW
jgi:hypothetical protein